MSTAHLVVTYHVLRMVVCVLSDCLNIQQWVLQCHASAFVHHSPRLSLPLGPSASAVWVLRAGVAECRFAAMAGLECRRGTAFWKEVTVLLASGVVSTGVLKAMVYEELAQSGAPHVF